MIERFEHFTFSVNEISKGMPANDIAEQLAKEREIIHVLAVLDTLEYLKKEADFSKPICQGYSGLNDSLLQKCIADSSKLWAGHKESLRISLKGSTIGTHIGPGAIAVAFFSK